MQLSGAANQVRFRPCLGAGPPQQFWNADVETSVFSVCNAVYLNQSILDSAEAAQTCKLINAHLDPYMEQILGYNMLKC